MAPREPLADDDKDLISECDCLCHHQDPKPDHPPPTSSSSLSTFRNRCPHGFGDRTIQDLSRIRSKITLTINESWTTVGHHQLPQWLQHSPYLLRGHRPQLRSLRVAFKSVFRLHSETLNIWSHFFGFLMFAYLAIDFFGHYGPELDRSHRMMSMIWFAGQILCCGLSTLYHTFNCHSDHVSNRLVKCDYLGIFASCWATLVTAGYYCLYCHPKALVGWLILSTVIVAIGPRLVMTENNLHRVMIYSAVVLPNLFAFLVSVTELIQYHPQRVGPAVWYLIGTYGFPFTGAIVYLQKIPERFAPGWFDLVGHSHQLMHLLVLGCMLSQYQLLLMATELRLNGRCDNY